MVFLGSADSFIAAECVFIQSRCLTRGLIAMICTIFDFQCRNHFSITNNWRNIPAVPGKIFLILQKLAYCWFLLLQKCVFISDVWQKDTIFVQFPREQPCFLPFSFAPHLLDRRFYTKTCGNLGACQELHFRIGPPQIITGQFSCHSYVDNRSRQSFRPDGGTLRIDILIWILGLKWDSKSHWTLSASSGARTAHVISFIVIVFFSSTLWQSL